MTWHSYELVMGLLLLSVIFIIVVQRFRLPSILAYLFVGIVVGPTGFNWLNSPEEVNLLAELGVVFLLFTIGLEMSFSRLWAMRHTVLVLGGLQVSLCIIIPTIFAYYLGMSLKSAFVASSALALSSTAIVIKQLKDQGELLQAHGKLSLGLLIFQDIAAIPLLIVIPMLAVSESAGLSQMLLWGLGKGILMVSVLILLSKYVLVPLFRVVINIAAQELFMLFVLLIVLSTAWLTHSAGLSMAFGAFVAGATLGETQFRNQLESDILPFRDILLGLFFISIGVRLNSDIFLGYWYWVLWLTGAIFVFKALLIAAIARVVGYADKQTALRSGLILAHGGEFGFALLALGMNGGIMENDYGQVVLCGIVLSMLLSTIIIRHHKSLVPEAV